MFVVIEGTDASGKTSLISAIKDEISLRYPLSSVQSFHKGRPLEETRRWVLNDYVLSIEKDNWTKEHAISDRWHWGEITYAPLKRSHTDKDGYGLLGKAGWRWVELFLQSRGISQFWLYQPLEVIQERLQFRGDDFVASYELKEILDQYMIAGEVSCSTEKIQPEKDSIDQIPSIAKSIVDIAERKATIVKEKRMDLFPEYIGSLTPSTILVGDRRNITKKHGEETILPFMPVDNNSGEFLLNSLPSAFWKNIGIVNVNDTQQPFDELWTCLGRPKVIALGRLAEKTLLAHKVKPCAVLPHPQYVKRFHHKDIEEYGRAIERNASSDNSVEGDKWILR